MVTLICARCGKAFSGERDRRFCSRTCANQTRGEGARLLGTYTCIVCGVAVETKSTLARRYHYCATCRKQRRATATTAARPRHYEPCAVCGKPFYQPPSKSHRQYCSQACKGMAARGKVMPNKPAQPDATTTLGIGGVRPDLGGYFRSRWEANYARYLRLTGQAYEYEPHRFVIVLPDGTEHGYTPDFLVNGQFYVEIKGWERPDRRQTEVLDHAPTVLPLPLVIVRRGAYTALQDAFAARIPAWEYAGSARPEQNERLCPVCGKPITSPIRSTRYCSRECFALVRRKPGRDCTCAACGKPFTAASWETERRFCSNACRRADQRSH